MDGSLVTPQVDQGLMCSNLHEIHSCLIRGGLRHVRNQYSCFHEGIMILELPGLPALPTDLSGLCPGPCSMAGSTCVPGRERFSVGIRVEGER